MIATLVLIGITIPTKILGDRSEVQVIQQTPLDVLTDTSDKQTIIEAIRYVAKKYLIDESSLMKTIECESGFRHEGIYGDSGLAYGLLQYHEPTFDQYCIGNYHSIKDQLVCSAEMFSKGLQRHWSCWKKYFNN